MWNLVDVLDKQATLAKPSFYGFHSIKGLRFGFERICSRHRSGGNVGIAERFPRTVGRAENLILVFRAFLRSAFPRLPGFHSIRNQAQSRPARTSRSRIFRYGFLTSTDAPVFFVRVADLV
jgi:hypothetical protein